MQIRVDNFGGVVLTKDPKKGPFWTALQASNCDIQNGSIAEGYVLDTASEAVIVGFTGRKTIYNLGGANFLDFAGDVNIVPAPIADNTTKRVYFTGDGPPSATDLLFATYGTLPYPTARFTLGYPVPKDFNYSTPGTNPALAVTGGAAPPETRAYVYTWVSPWGEESAPCNPVQTIGNITGTWRLRMIGALSGTRDFNALMAGTPANFAFAAGTVTITLPIGGITSFRKGDLILAESTNGALSEFYRAAHVVADVNNGAGTIKVRWAGQVPAAGLVWRVGPINTYNVTNALRDTPSAGKVKVFVDLLHGLRVGDRVFFNNVGGMTDLNFVVGQGPYVVEALVDTGAETSFVISLATAQAYTIGGEASRDAPYFAGLSAITNVTIAAGVVTVTLNLNITQGGTAHMAVGDKVLIQGILGAVEANGVRTITAITSGATFQFALAGAMTAYTGGGVVHSPSPIPYVDHPLTFIAYAAGVFTFTVGEAHDFKVGDEIIVWGEAGMVEANNSFIVASVAAGGVVTANTAYGAAGVFTGPAPRIAKIQHQARKRIYRTNQALSGIADFQLVAEVGNEKCDYDDSIASANLGAIMVSDGWIQPPIDLISLVAHPDGFLEAYSPAAKALCCSEPYQPHAWPIAYQRPIPVDGVGVEIYGTTAVVLTKDKPFNVTGAHPSALSVVRQEVGEACTSKRSIVATGLGVVYRGISGFFILGYYGANNATRNYLPPAGFIAPTDTMVAYWRNKIIWIDNATLSGFIFDPVYEDKALVQFDVDYPIYGLHVSPVDGQLWASYVKNGTQPRRAPLFKIVANPARFTYVSQYLYVPKPTAMAALQVDWSDDLQSPAMKDREKAIVRNLRRRAGRYAAINDHVIDATAINGDEFETIYAPDMTLSTPAERYLYVTVTADADKSDKARVVFQDFVTSKDPVRMNAGVKSDCWQIKMVGVGKVTAATIAPTIEELAQT